MEPIAIIGMACRYPGACDLDQYWRLLRDGIDAIGMVPPDRWQADQYYDADARRPGKMTTRYGGFLPEIDQFDRAFFGISPREAARMDPQQRLLLETTWEALEHGGVVPERLAGTKAGVFVGVMNSDYGQLQARDLSAIDPYTGPGSHLSITANRISYAFDLRGPSMAIDTACSSSLVALHLACQSLASGDSAPIAIVGGVNVVISPAGHIFFSKAGVVAPDGRSRSFDASANGFVRAEGVGVVVLKPLARALKDGDPVHAVIRGSAINQDGRTNGLMAPNRFSQEAVLREAYARAGVSPGMVQYVEAHGTGTLLGDPIEATALGTVLADGRPSSECCVLGSVKSNLGHLESAAGLAGVIKVALMFRHGQIPPSLHFSTPNPHIDFANLPLRVAQRLEPWPAPRDSRRLAGVSGFGYGGANAHVVLEAPPPVAVRDEPAADRERLLPLSARSPEALRALVQRFAERADLPLADLSYTLGERRTHHDHRVAITCRTGPELADACAAYLAGEFHPSVAAGRRFPGRRLKPVFVFSGQGPQWWAMGRELLAEEPTFRAAVAECDRLLGPWTGWSLLAELRAPEAESRLAETAVAQPALFALQVGLSALLRSWGVEPAAVIGHSVGEIAAAHVCGALSLQDALRVVYHRSVLMQRLTGAGRMVAVELPAEALSPYLEGRSDRLSLAARNSPTSSVIAGEPGALAELCRELARRGVQARELPVNYAFHSPQVAPLQGELEAALAGLCPAPSSLPVYLTADGWPTDDLPFTPAYWARQMRASVVFQPAVAAAVSEGANLFVEIGPHPVLSGYLTQTLQAMDKEAVVLPSLRRGEFERRSLLQSLGAIWAAGGTARWNQLEPSRGSWLPLPAYPWQRERCWFTAAAAEPASIGPHPMLGQRLAVAQPAGAHLWTGTLSTKRFPFLADHRIQGAVVVPGTTYLELALAALHQSQGDGPWELRDLATNRAFFLQGQEPHQVQVWLTPEADGGHRFSVYSSPDANPTAGPAWTLHATGHARALQAPEADAPPPLANLQARCRMELPADSYYRSLPGKGLEYGPAFRGITRLWCAPGEALAQVVAPACVSDQLGAYHLHPALLDACGHLLLATEPEQGDVQAIYMPVGTESVRVMGPFSTTVWSHAERLPTNAQRPDLVTGRILIYSDDGRIVAQIDGLQFQRLHKGTTERPLNPHDWLFQVRWEERLVPPAAPPAGRWLVLGDRGEVGAALLRCIEEAGGCALMLPPDAAPGALAQAIQAADELAGVLSLQSLRTDPSEATQACSAALHLFQSLRVHIRQPVRTYLVTQGAAHLSGHGMPNPAAAALWGFARSVSTELPALWGGLIDLDAAATPDEAAAALWAELGRSDGEDQVALRGSTRFVARLRPLESSQTLRPLTIRRDGSYLITGGLGDLGLTVARWLVREGAARLILMGRTPLPQRSDWAAAATTTRLGRQISAVRELEALGAAVHLATVDLADPTALPAFLAEYRREGWPPIRGVIHAAGSAAVQPAAEMQEQDLAGTLGAKALGGWHLHQQLTQEPLDFFVLFSSASALLSSPGLSAYAAGNAYLDALAQYRLDQGMPALSIGWGPWAEVGMAARQGGRHSFGVLAPISPDRGLELLDLCMRQTAPQVAVLPFDWSAWRQLYGSARVPLISDLLSAQSTTEESEVPAHSRGSVLQKILSAPPDQARSLTDSYLRDLVARVLRLPSGRLDHHLSVLDLGLDSLMLTELRSRVETDLAISLPLVTLLQGPTVAQLSELLVAEVQAAGAREQVAANDETPRTVPAEELLARVGELSEGEVDELLGEMLDEGDLERLLDQIGKKEGT